VLGQQLSQRFLLHVLLLSMHPIQTFVRRVIELLTEAVALRPDVIAKLGSLGR